MLSSIQTSPITGDFFIFFVPSYGWNLEMFLDLYFRIVIYIHSTASRHASLTWHQKQSRELKHTLISQFCCLHTLTVPYAHLGLWRRTSDLPQVLNFPSWSLYWRSSISSESCCDTWLQMLKAERGFHSLDDIWMCYCFSVQRSNPMRFFPNSIHVFLTRTQPEKPQYS